MENRSYVFYGLLLICLVLCSCRSPVNEIPQRKNEVTLTSDDSLFPDCDDINVDTVKLEENFDKTGILFFGEDVFYNKSKKALKTKISTSNIPNGFDYLAEIGGKADTLFTYKIKDDSLYIWEKLNKQWECKIALHKNKKLDPDKLLLSTITYYYSDYFNNSDIRIFHVVDINNSCISHCPKNEDIKLKEFYTNRENRIIAVKYKCDYFYVR